MSLIALLFSTSNSTYRGLIALKGNARGRGLMNGICVLTGYLKIGTSPGFDCATTSFDCPRRVA